MKSLKVKIIRLSWVLIMLVCAFLLGRFLQPKTGSMARGMRQTPQVDFSRMRAPNNRAPASRPLRRNQNPYQR